MSLLVKAMMLLFFISGSTTSNEIKGTIKITVLVNQNRLTFEKEYAEIYSLTQLIQKFIFGKISEKIATNIRNHRPRELTISEQLTVNIQKESDDQKNNRAYCSEVFPSENPESLTFSELPSSTETLLDQQTFLETTASTTIDNNTVTFHFNVPFIASFNSNGEPLIGIKATFDKIYDELQTHLISEID
ncbi:MULTISPECIES: hypothetical protein [unclassified Endozoicomonas]|uniref:hypothetical protein n=1 Tax=unclassified Endozoicomonas TaxID=2644528 RepID=UPI0021479F97|nr:MULTISPECIES: hypothetical protein [unclassified Endozoicomonas]